MLKTMEEKMGLSGTKALFCEFTSKNRRRLNAILFLLALSAMFWEALSPWARHAESEEALAAIGWLLVLAGLGVRFWVALYLGGRKNKQLITEGPYGLVRNPMYAGNFISVTGLALLSESIAAGLIMLSGTLLLYNATIRYEEHRLVKKFPDQYRIYCQRVPRLLPKLKNIRQLLENRDAHCITYQNVRRELVGGFWLLAGAFAIHLAAEAIDYMYAANWNIFALLHPFFTL